MSMDKEERGKVEAGRQTEIMAYIINYNPLNSKITLHEHTRTILWGREEKKKAIGGRSMGNMARNRPGGHEVKEREIIESISRRRFCHHGREIAEEVWIDNGVLNFNVKQDALGSTEGTIFFIFRDWYFGALIFSVVNAAAKRRSKFAFDRSQ